MKYKILKNKFTALMLTGVMVVSTLLSGVVFGAENDSADSRAVKFLTALDIMKPDENTGLLWDDTPVRRGEMAEILCKM